MKLLPSFSSFFIIIYIFFSNPGLAVMHAYVFTPRHAPALPPSCIFMCASVLTDWLSVPPAPVKSYINAARLMPQGRLFVFCSDRLVGQNCLIDFKHAPLPPPCFPPQAKYDDIKKVVKAAAEGPMKGVLAYTEHQARFSVFSLTFELICIDLRASSDLLYFPTAAGRLHRLQRRHALLHLRRWRWHRPQRPLCQTGLMVRLFDALISPPRALSHRSARNLFVCFLSLSFSSHQVRQRVWIQQPRVRPDGPHGCQGVN